MSAADRREAILAAALDAFAAGGYHETSLEDVAERAGISKALIYEHFASKRELHRRPARDLRRASCSRRVAEATAAAEPGEERLRAGLDGFLALRRGAPRRLADAGAQRRRAGDLAASFERLRHEAAAAITALMVEDAPPRSSSRGNRARAGDRDARRSSWSAPRSRSPTGGTSTARSRGSRCWRSPWTSPGSASSASATARLDGLSAAEDRGPIGLERRSGG